MMDTTTAVSDEVYLEEASSVTVLTVITALKYLVHLPADVIPLEERKVSSRYANF